MSFPVKFSGGSEFSVGFGTSEEMRPTFTATIEKPVVDWFDGDYSYTPTTQEQTIPIIGKTARQNITVGAIPQNYGLITWNGAVLTVS